MTDDYERYLDGFGERLAAVSDRRRRGFTPALRRPATLVVIGAVVVAAVGIVVTSGGGELDPVARADAALAPSGRIIHVKFETRFVALPGASAPRPQSLELWSAGEPLRWRIRQVFDARTRDNTGRQRGPEEYAYADGVGRNYRVLRDRLRVTKGVPSKRAPSPIPIDPERDIRPLLQQGKFRDGGVRTVDGRRVRRLISETTTAKGKLGRRVVYDVDADTFEPVAGEIRLTAHGHTRRADGKLVPQAITSTALFRVVVYERLPDDAAHAGLLRITTTPRTKVTTTTRLRRSPSPSPARARARRC